MAEREDKMARAKYCVFVGRFQPFHNGHLKVLLKAFDEAEHVLVVVGSYRVPRSLKNPWSVDERMDIIRQSVPAGLRERMTLLPLRDFTYNDLHWITSLQNVVSENAEHTNGRKNKLIGCFKDDSSYYLNLFPQWELVREPYYDSLDASTVRDALFENGIVRHDLVPGSVADFLGGYLKSERYQELKKEHEFLKKYKAQWAQSPFPPVFVTTDAVVVKAGHVLLIRRKFNPGKGRLALPGGFIKPNETIYASAIRELKEETKILIPRETLHGSLAGEHVFDHPSRDARGRTITHAYYFKLEGGGPLPEVEGDDDAKEALWVPLSELALLEEQFYSDHLHIINYFVMGNV